MPDFLVEEIKRLYKDCFMVANLQIEFFPITKSYLHHKEMDRRAKSSRGKTYQIAQFTSLSNQFVNRFRVFSSCDC